MEFRHESVLLEECIEALQIKEDGVYVDGTIGGAGHAQKVVERLSGRGRLVGIDRDEDAIAAATDRLISYKDRVTILRGSYRDLPALLSGVGIREVDGILLDLGVSSYQLDSADRGFTYQKFKLPALFTSIDSNLSSPSPHASLSRYKICWAIGVSK